MSNLSMKQLLESGSHFGHQTKRWNPKMKKYIFGSRNSIYIIDLQKTLRKFNEAYEHVKDLAAEGGTILFVGTKKQAQDLIASEAKRCSMFYVNQRWLGGMLTNFNTIKNSIDRLKNIEEMKANKTIDALTKKEGLKLDKTRIKLEKYLGGIKDMDQLPDAIFIVDPKKEKIALKEAIRVGISTIAIVDTNCNPDGIDYIIPSNDDAIRAIKLITSKIVDAVLAGKNSNEDIPEEAPVEEIKANETEQAEENNETPALKPEETATTEATEKSS